MTAAAVDRSMYPFTGHTQPLRAGRMHYVDEGAGEPVVLVHGTPSWSFEWRHLIRELSTSHRVIAPDHLGFGLSERPRGAAYTPAWHAANFAEFIERTNPGPFTLVVHDFGGPIALPFAIEHPARVKRVIVLNSWMWSFAGDAAMERAGRIAGGTLGRLLYEWVNFSPRVIMPSAYGDKRKLTPEIHGQYLDRFPDHRSRREVLWTLARELLGSSEFYDSLWQRRAALAATPSLIVWGMKDSAFRPYQLEKWKSALPQARVVEIAGAGHWPQEEEPAAVATAVREFLAPPG